MVFQAPAPGMPGTPPPIFPAQLEGQPDAPFKAIKPENNPPSAKSKSLNFNELIEVPRIDKPKSGKGKGKAKVVHADDDDDSFLRSIKRCCYCQKILSGSARLIRDPASGKHYHKICSPYLSGRPAEDE